MAPTTTTRPVYLTREGSTFRLAFPFDRALVERVRELPYATFDEESRTWTAHVYADTVEDLRRWYFDGLLDTPPDDLVEPGEKLAPCPPATVRAGSARRPYLVHTARRDDRLYAKLRAIPGGRWEKKAKATSFPAQATAALAEMVARGVLADPSGLLSGAAVTVTFDARNGRFAVNNPKAQDAFNRYFPGRDVVTEWLAKGIDVEITDAFSEQIYRGELARAAGGIQPEGMLAELYPYQAASVALAAQREGLGIFDEMGLGKTIQAIATGYQAVTVEGVAPRTVCVVPAAVRTQWREEIERFTGQTDIVVVDGDPATRAEHYEDAKTARWVILPFSQTLTSDADAIAPLVSGAVLVADEAHRLRNPTSKRSKTMARFSGRAFKRIALTGTPVDNSPGEMWAVLNFCMPGALGTSFDWMSRYSYPGRFGGFEGARNLDELRSRTAPLYVRRTKRQVAEHLPPLRVKHQSLDPDPAYAAALKRAHREAAEEIREDAVARAGRSAKANGVLDGELFDNAANGAQMTAVGMLRLLCSSPRCISESDSGAAEALREAGLLPDEDGPKVDRIREICADMRGAGDRVVIFTFSKRMAYLIAQRLEEDNIGHVLFTGDQNTAARDAAVRAFTTPDRAATDTDEGFCGPTAFIATDAGGEGLNLSACCSTLVNADLPWTPGALAQRAARIHRVNSTHDSYLVINLTLTGTLEWSLLKMLEHKADVVDAILGENGGRARTTGRRGRGGSMFEQALREHIAPPPPATPVEASADDEAAATVLDEGGPPGEAPATKAPAAKAAVKKSTTKASDTSS